MTVRIAEPESSTRSAPTGTQTTRAVVDLRNMIAGGSLNSGERLTEVDLAERLGMSRTPVRAAIQQLRDEGLLEKQPAGGYTVRGFTPQEIAEAIELRGLIEGFAVRLVAEQGAKGSDLARFDTLVERIDDLILGRDFGTRELSGYGTLNAELHEALTEATGSPLIVQEARRANARPFAWASAFVVDMHDDMVATHRLLIIAHDQHRAIVEAIRVREGGRAEAIMREHARLPQRNLTRALRTRTPAELARGRDPLPL